MRALLTGATGFYGGNLLRALHARGMDVRYLSRGGKPAVCAKDLDRVECVAGDVNDVEAIAAASRDVDWVFHAAAIASMDKRERPMMEKVNVEGTELMLAAARRAGVKRFIYVSAVAAIGHQPAGTPAVEDTLRDVKELANPYPETKRAAEERVIAAARDGFDAVVVNPGYMIGAFDVKPTSNRMVLEIMKGNGLLYSGGGNCFVDVLDVCEGTLQAAERGERGERYILGGHNLSYQDFFTRAASVVGRRRPIGRAPFSLAWLVALGAEGVARIAGKTPMISRDEIAFAEVPHYFSSEKATHALGYRISPIEPAIKRAADWFRENGYVR